MSSQNFENYLLKSLIQDIDTNNGFSNSKNFSEFEKKFNNSSNSLRDSLTDSSSGSDQDTLAMSPESNNLSFTHQEILISLSNQKNAIHLQSTIRETNPFEISNFIKAIQGDIPNIMMDKNGNYLCTDLFKVCTPFQRISILKQIFNVFDIIAIHEYGTHPTQTLIELAKTAEEIMLITSALSNQNKILNVAFNPNGSYVIQKIIMNIPEQNRQNFNFYLLNIIPYLSQDMYGVCTAKKFVTFSQSPFLVQEIIKIVMSNFFAIANNQYGNYLIQYILEIWWNKKELFYIKKIIENYFFQLSSNQFASHIAESYINMLNDKEKQFFLSSLLKSGIYFLLLKDKYGVYVMNKLSSNSVKKAKN